MGNRPEHRRTDWGPVLPAHALDEPVVAAVGRGYHLTADVAPVLHPLALVEQFELEDNAAWHCAPMDPLLTLRVDDLARALAMQRTWMLSSLSS